MTGVVDEDVESANEALLLCWLVSVLQLVRCGVDG